MENKENVTTSHLSWRCIDNFDKAYPNNVCWTGSFDLSSRQAVILRDTFSALKEEWSRQIRMAFAEDEESLEIAGGNYTFFFVLPAVFKYFREHHPFLSVKLSLFELSDEDSLMNCSADIVLSSFYEHTDIHKMTADIFASGYFFQRRLYNDNAFFASSLDSHRKYGSKEKILKEHDIVLDRLFDRYSVDKKEKQSLAYNTVPNGRHNETHRISIDFYFMGYHFMLEDLGISRVFKSDTNISQVFILNEEPIATMKRVIISRKSLNKSYLKSVRNCLMHLRGYNEKSVKS